VRSEKAAGSLDPSTSDGEVGELRLAAAAAKRQAAMCR